MCGGVRYEHEGKLRTTYFPMAHAQLPILTENGEIQLMEWGRREKEEGHLPKTGWARLDSIQDGKWSRYSPAPVRILVKEYMEKDAQRQSHWYPLRPGEYIQGLQARLGEEARVYVVTVPAPTAYEGIHDRWPRVRFDPRMA